MLRSKKGLRVVLCWLAVSLGAGPGVARADGPSVPPAVVSDGLALATELADGVGARLTGSEGAERAVTWALAAMKRAGLSRVRREPIKTRKWERVAEQAMVIAPMKQPLRVTALGGTVSTDAVPGHNQGIIEAEAIEADSIAALLQLGDKVRGKIVVLTQEMKKTPDFSGYRDAGPARWQAPTLAGKAGAVALLIRSVGTGLHRLPHTGGLHYDDGAPKIPAGALAAEDAMLVSRLLKQQQPVRLRLQLVVRDSGLVDSANVVGELPGRALAREIVLLGAHLDSWDLGTGALDDAVGCGMILDVAKRIARDKAGVPRSLRVVFFMNEELGLSGARGYAEAHKAELPLHVAAIEADSGAGAPLGFRVVGGAPAADLVKGWLAGAPSSMPTTVQTAEEWGADLMPLQAAGVPILGVEQDVSDYFEWHHTAGDTVDKISPSALEQTTQALQVLTTAALRAPVRLPPSAGSQRFK